MPFPSLAVCFLSSERSFRLLESWLNMLAYVFTLGALSYSGTQILRRYEGKNTTIIRLRRQEIIGAFLLMVSAVLMLVSSFSLVAFARWRVEALSCRSFSFSIIHRLPSSPRVGQRKCAKRSRKTDKPFVNSAICCIFAITT